MEVILYTNINVSDHFLRSALEIGFDEFVARKFIYITQFSDLDVLQLMGDERLHLLLYGWEIVNKHMQTIVDANTIPENVLTVIKQLTHYSLDLWFAKEWGDCKEIQKLALIYCLKRARPFIENSTDLKKINWNYLHDLDVNPWSIDYLKVFLEAPARETDDIKQVIETVEIEASREDILFLNQERFIIIVLRLIKMFDAGALVGVKNLAMRVISAWNHEFEAQKQSSRTQMIITEDDKRCLILICHIYLMSIYEMDDERGFAIDNMVHSVRFYCRSLKEASKNPDYVVEKLTYTPALYIATTCNNLDISGYEFFEVFIFDAFDEHFTTLFGAISHAYLSYIIGNMLMELNNQNEEDFKKNVDYFKRLINLYVPKRECSELFMLSEMRKQELQRNSHSECDTVKNMTNFKSKICKGNRMSNIGAYEENDKIEPVFQNLPNNQNILNYAYDLVAKKNYKGWHLAKIVLLLKLIGHELNTIETWRYHSGVNVEFMLSLESKLSLHFVDLAQIFQTHPFIEREFWLTAFYLNPCTAFYGSVVRCGLRFHRRRQNDEQQQQQQQGTERAQNARTHDKNEQNTINAKFGLLSSTIDVKEIVELTNQEAPTNDYEQLQKALEKFRLPDNMIKDLLTVAFLPRNKAFAWAVHWPELRKRCKALVNHPERKRNLVELNMAEANDRLKFLHINYEKYKHRPQLDYGTIEQGYENINNYDDNDDNNSLIESDDDDYNDYEKIKKVKNVKKPRFEYVDKNDDDDDDDNMDGEDDDEEDDETCEGQTRRPKTDNLFNMKEFHLSTRRKTRARTAAAIASARHEFDEKQEKLTIATTTNKSNSSTEMESAAVIVRKETMNSPTTTSASASAPPPLPTIAPPPLPTIAPPVIKSTDENVTQIDLRALLNERITYSNATNGFTPFPDIWDIDAQKSETSKAIELFETQNLLNKFTKCQQTINKVADLRRVNEIVATAGERNKSMANIENNEEEETLSAQETRDYLANEHWNTEAKAENSNAHAQVLLGSMQMNAQTRLVANDDDDADSLLSETSTSAVKDSGEVNYFSKDDDDYNNNDDDEDDKVDVENVNINVMSDNNNVNSDDDESIYDEHNDNHEMVYETENRNKNFKQTIATEAQNLQVNKNVHVAFNIFRAEVDHEINVEVIVEDFHKTIENKNNEQHQMAKIVTNESTEVVSVQKEVEKQNVPAKKKNSQQQNLNVKHFRAPNQLANETPAKIVEHKISIEVASSSGVSSNNFKETKREHKTETTKTTKSTNSTASKHKTLTATETKALTAYELQMNKLKLECKNRRAIVQLKRLNVKDFTIIFKLRQPIVRVKRLNEKMIKDSKRKRRCKQFKSYIDCYDSSSNSAYSQTKRANANKQNIRKRSQSTSASSLASDEYLAKRRVVNNDNKRTSGENKRHSAPREGKTRKMVVTPRSASGLKLRIAAMDHSRSNTTSATNSNSNSKQNTPEPECIQILSSSDDEQTTVTATATATITTATTTTTAAAKHVPKQLKTREETEMDMDVDVNVEIEDLEVLEIEEVATTTATHSACERMQVELVEEENASILLNPIVDDDENIAADPLYYDQDDYSNNITTYSISFL